MGKRSKVVQLPRELREWLDRILAEKNYSAYEQVTADLRVLGEKLGVAPEDLPGKSALHRYGANLERKLAAIKASTHAAQLIAAQSPDEADDRSAAVMSMIQTEMFDGMLLLQEAEDTGDPLERAKALSAIAKNYSPAARVSMALKKHQIEVRSRTQAAADAAVKIAKKGGLTAQSVDAIRREILGIAA